MKGFCPHGIGFGIILQGARELHLPMHAVVYAFQTDAPLPHVRPRNGSETASWGLLVPAL
ncbi:MAG: hypothetical protein F4100_01290 [Rhodothermaceae bacterium]|nr:hypothetical protein [Rhodothermaceae bacterium]MYE64034.1 hypothetical protein [Rhodothermaceae bacterium]MYJ19369.1 hypothetical protein [Rhodothermaceae bacterium]